LHLAAAQKIPDVEVIRGTGLADSGVGARTEVAQMKTVVGTFPSQTAVEAAVNGLRQSGIDRSRINVLTPRSGPAEIRAVPEEDAEAEGVGTAMGAVVGGAAGMSAGLALPTVLTLFIPGLGPVVAAGAVGAALLGLGGALGGAAAGHKIEETLTEGLPKDELPVYLDALRRGRSVVVVLTKDDDEIIRTREILEQAGAESLDAARDMWWIGLRDAEEEEYAKDGKDFAADEALYRRGFEAALGEGAEGSTSASDAALRARYGEAAGETAFRRGFERGCLYRDSRIHHPEMS